MRSVSNLSRSSCCGGHFQDLSPYLPSVSVSASASVGRILSSEFFPVEMSFPSHSFNDAFNFFD